MNLAQVASVSITREQNGEPWGVALLTLASGTRMEGRFPVYLKDDLMSAWNTANSR